MGKLSAAMEKAQSNAQRATEEAEHRRAEEKKAHQEKHDGWVKEQNEFWEKWRKRKERNERQDEERKRRESAASESKTAESSSSLGNSHKPASGNREVNTTGNLSGSAPNRARQRFSLQDALRTFYSVAGDRPQAR